MSWKQVPWADVKPGQKFRFVNARETCEWTRASSWAEYAVQGHDITKVTPNAAVEIEVSLVQVNTLKPGTKVRYEGREYTVISRTGVGTPYFALVNNSDFSYEPWCNGHLVEVLS